jgi:hypothetical protein
MIIGYARVSTDGQTLNAKPDALTSAGAGKVLLKVWTKGQPKPHVGGTARTPVAEVGHQECNLHATFLTLCWRELARPRISNRSHVTSNRVSDAAIRILKICDRRLANEIGRLRRKIQKITRQRLRDISLTLGNVARIFATRT